jgi:ABC-type nitrate/sulfonate/bicarbonate transport system substrate-binding protein
VSVTDGRERSSIAPVESRKLSWLAVKTLFCSLKPNPPHGKTNIQFTVFPAFHAPLIATMPGGFLKEEGLGPEWSVSPPGVSAMAALEDSSAHVV